MHYTSNSLRFSHLIGAALLALSCTAPPQASAGSESLENGFAGRNDYLLGESAGAGSSFSAQGMSDSVGEFGGNLSVSIPAYRVNGHVGYLRYANASEWTTFSSLLAERNGLPFQWHRPWLARLTISNATRSNHTLVGTNPAPQSAYVEYPDGRRERLYSPLTYPDNEEHVRSINTSQLGHWQRIGEDTVQVTSADGMRYTFNNGPCFGTFDNHAGLCEATEVEDRFGNGTRISYYGQSDSDRENDSAVPRILESFRRGSNGSAEITGRVYFYLGREIGDNANPSGEPTDYFWLHSPWRAFDRQAAGELSELFIAWENHTENLISAIAYPGPSSNALSIDPSWLVTHLQYGSSMHGFVGEVPGQAGDVFVNWTQLRAIDFEEEKYEFRYRLTDFAPQLPPSGPDDFRAAGLLEEVRLPRLNGRVRYDWALPAAGQDVSGNDTGTRGGFELGRRTFSANLPDGTPDETLIWGFAHQDVAREEDGNINRYRGSFVNYPTGMSTARLFFPLAQDGTPQAARSGLVAEERTYAHHILVDAVPGSDSLYALTGSIQNLPATQIVERGYATRQFGSVLLEAPQGQDFPSWTLSLFGAPFQLPPGEPAEWQYASPEPYNILAFSYGGGHWRAKNFMGFIALPAYDVTRTTATTGGAGTQCCAAVSSPDVGSWGCRFAVGQPISPYCPNAEGTPPFSSAPNCFITVPTGCSSVSFGGSTYWCARPLSDDYCPSSSTTVSSAECAALPTCGSMPAPTDAAQTVVRMFRSNLTGGDATAWTSVFEWSGPPVVTQQPREDYDWFFHKPFERTFVPSGEVTVHRSPSTCTSTCQWESIGGWWRCGNVQPDGSIDATNWSCINDVVEATPSGDPTLSSETRIEYRVERDPTLYAKGRSRYEVGLLSQPTRIRTCDLNSTCELGAGLRSETTLDYDHEQVAYPFDATSGQAALLGRRTYERSLLLDNPSESPETYFQYFDRSDVAHEPAGALAEVAARIDASRFRRTRHSYSDPQSVGTGVATLPRRTWVLDENGAPRLLARVAYNGWMQATLTVGQNGESRRNCYDRQGVLIAEFSSAQTNVASANCPSGEEDAPTSQSRVWVDRIHNIVRARTRTQYQGSTIASNVAVVYDAMGRELQTRTGRSTEIGERTLVTSADYFANTGLVTRGTVAVATAQPVAAFSDYTFSGARAETSYDVFGRAVGSQTMNANGTVLSQTSTRYGDTDPTLPTNHVQSTDAEGEETSLVSDAMGRPVKTILPDGNEIRRSYDRSGRLIDVTHPDGRQTRYQYDGLGRTIRVTAPESGSTSRTFDRLSQVTSSVDPGGTTQRFAYDSLGRLLSRTAGSGSTATVLSSVTYDEAPADSLVLATGDSLGKPTRIRFAHGQMDLGFDAEGNMIEAVVSLVGLAPKRFTRTYDSMGSLRAEAYQPGELDGFAWRQDLNGNGETLRTVRTDGVAQTLTAFDYDELGRPLYRDVLTGLPGFQRENYRYDDFGSLVQVNDPSNLGSDVFAYRVASHTPTLGSPRHDGLPSEIEWATAGVGRAAYVYGYDNRGRLTSADFREHGQTGWVNAGLHDFSASYDSVGAPIAMSRTSTQGPQFTSFSYDANTRRLLQTTGAVATSFAYDAGGLVTENSEWGGTGNSALTYNADRLPSSVANGTRRTEFAYGIEFSPVRISDHVWTSPCPPPDTRGSGASVAAAGCYVLSGTTHIVRDLSGAPMAEYKNGRLQRIYVAGVGAWVPTSNPEQRPGGYYASFTDPVGSQRAVLHSDGHLVQATDFGPYGTELPGRSVDGVGHGFESYATHRQRSEMQTPFFLAGARLYHPGIGRFLSPDPLAQRDDTNNAYNYAYSNPAAYNDPTGLCPGCPVVLPMVEVTATSLQAAFTSTLGPVSSLNAGPPSIRALVPSVQPAMPSMASRAGLALMSQAHPIVTSWLNARAGIRAPVENQLTDPSAPSFVDPNRVTHSPEYNARLSELQVQRMNDRIDQNIQSRFDGLMLMADLLTFGETTSTRELIILYAKRSARRDAREIAADLRRESPAFRNSPYHPQTVADRTRPPYHANPQHDPRSPAYNPRGGDRTPEPADAASVYETAVRGDMGAWYAQGTGGWYRYFSDNAGSAHFSGVVASDLVPIDIRRALGQ